MVARSPNQLIKAIFYSPGKEYLYHVSTMCSTNSKCPTTISGSPLLPMPHAFSFFSSMRGKPRRGMLRRAVFSDMQRKGLEKMFQKQKYISKPDRKKLATKLGLKDSQVILKNHSLRPRIGLHVMAVIKR